MPWQNYRDVVSSKRRSKSRTAKAKDTHQGKRARVRIVNAPKNPW